MNPSDDNPQTQCQAIDWALQLRMGELSPPQRQRFEQWLAAHPSHADALAEAEMTWELSGELADSPLFARPVAAVPRKPRRRLGNWLSGLVRRWPSALLAGFLCAAILLGWQPLWLYHAADYQTAKGEIREIHLPDDSRILLGSRSAVAVHYNGEHRQVQLLRGEALFSPAPLDQQEQRPFVVASAGGLNQALGTVFLVRREHADQAHISILEHSVRISLPEQQRPSAAQLVLHQGESAVYHRHQGIQREAVNPQHAASWSRGLLIFEDSTLADVVARLDEYHPGKLLLLDRQAGQQTITAAFHLDSLDSALQILGNEYQLQVTRLPGLTLLR